MKKVCTNKTCSHKGEPQDVSNFYRDSGNTLNRQVHCKDCVKQYKSQKIIG